ncbi:hypothetical protein EJP617_25010 [Erwinia sp. Ejp617]|nr:hypothetical protein EJP617_25010 [Erwinia sp. Ejp617]
MGRSIGDVFAFANTIFCYFVDFVSICTKVAKIQQSRAPDEFLCTARAAERYFFAHSKTGQLYADPLNLMVEE